MKNPIFFSFQITDLTVAEMAFSQSFQIQLRYDTYHTAKAFRVMVFIPLEAVT